MTDNGAPDTASVDLEAPRLPALFDAADRASLRAQRQFLRRRQAGFALLIAAASTALVPLPVLGAPHYHIEPGILFAGFILIVTAMLETTMLTKQPERRWYQGRAVAESVKTLAWRYAAAGDPFPKDLADPDALFEKRLGQVREQFPQLGLAPAGSTPQTITSWMRALRAAPLSTRRRVYRAARIGGQRRWYATKSEWNQHRIYVWSAIILTFQVLGLGAAVVKGVGLVAYNGLPLAATLASIAIAWTQIKQHATLAESYSVAAGELASMLASDPADDDEDAWTRFVDQGENAISREHTTWRAKRS